LSPFCAVGVIKNDQLLCGLLIICDRIGPMTMVLISATPYERVVKSGWSKIGKLLNILAK
jgi:hypothetical protein